MSRMNFIPALREKLKANLVKQGINERVVDTAFTQWDAGEEPSSPFVRMCFQVFEKIQKEVDAGREP